MTENALRLDWADFEPEDDLHAVGLALLVAGIVVDTDEAGNELPGDLVRLDLRTAEIVLDALRSSGRTLAFAADTRRTGAPIGCGTRSVMRQLRQS